MQHSFFQHAYNTAHAIADLPVPFVAGLDPRQFHKGKTKDNYILPDGSRIIIATDVLSSFDKAITAIPFKGAAQTHITSRQFNDTADICPNHIIARPDPNILVCKQLQMIPVEVVVRDYMTGTSATSILTMYQKGMRHMYGIDFPDGIRPHQRLDRPIVTPTTKAPNGEHDMPISAREIIEAGTLTPAQWAEIEDIALRLFARGQAIAKEKELILCDTKYEFGFDKQGQIVLGDEIHTFDTSRYWLTDSYERAFAEGKMPPSLDREVTGIRDFLKADPAFMQTGAVPEIPPHLKEAASRTALALCERMTGVDCTSEATLEQILQRMQTNLSGYIKNRNPQPECRPGSNSTG